MCESLVGHTCGTGGDASGRHQVCQAHATAVLWARHGPLSRTMIHRRQTDNCRTTSLFYFHLFYLLDVACTDCSPVTRETGKWAFRQQLVHQFVSVCVWLHRLQLIGFCLLVLFNANIFPFLCTGDDALFPVFLLVVNVGHYCVESDSHYGLLVSSLFNKQTSGEKSHRMLEIIVNR